MRGFLNIKKRIMKAFKAFSPLATVLLIMLFAYTVILLGMYIWGFFTSLKTITEFRKNMFGIPNGWPWKWEWKNYVTVFNSLYVNVYVDGVKKYVYLDGMLFNSLFYSLSGALVYSFVQWFVAAVLAKYKDYRFTKFLMSLNIILMIVPIFGTLPATLRFYKFLGLYDTWGFAVVNSISFWGQYLIVFYLFLTSIGKEYYEAAYLDGAGNLRILFSIIFPLTAQMFLIIFLLSFIGRWNDYMTMVIWMPSKPTLAYGLYKFSTDPSTATSWPPQQIAGCIVLMVPVLAVFLKFQKHLMGNIRMGALKG